MSWKNAPSVAAALAEATRRWPKRSRASDGTIGDTAHAERTSDHNPDANGVVHAFDLTHDPTNGVDCAKLVEHLITERDRRVKYIIWNRKICNSPSWSWSAYAGANPHTKHMHVSIQSTAIAENDTSDWWADDEVIPIVEYIVAEMKRNASGPDAQKMKSLNVPLFGTAPSDHRNSRWWQELMRLGINLPKIPERLGSKVAALLIWAWLVRQNGPWDHKQYISKTFHPRNPNGPQHWHLHKKFLYYYDIWSNIHYGYVGIAAGFSRSELLDGAGMEQIGSDALRKQLPKASPKTAGLRKYDDPSDRAAIEIGIRLYNRYRLAVTVAEVLTEVEDSKQLDKKPFANSK